MTQINTRGEGVQNVPKINTHLRMMAAHQFKNKNKLLTSYLWFLFYKMLICFHLSKTLLMHIS